MPQNNIIMRKKTENINVSCFEFTFNIFSNLDVCFRNVSLFPEYSRTKYPQVFHEFDLTKLKPIHRERKDTMGKSHNT